MSATHGANNSLMQTIAVVKVRGREGLAPLLRFEPPAMNPRD